MRRAPCSVLTSQIPDSATFPIGLFWGFTMTLGWLSLNWQDLAL